MKFKFTFFLPFFVLLVLLSQLSFAQTSSSDVKVDELTDAQVREYMRRAESIGYSDAQIEQMAAAQGMKPEEVQKLRARVDKIRKQEGSTTETTVKKQEDNTRVYEDNTSNKTKNTAQPTEIVTNTLPKVFGAELFKNGDITFEPNLRMATPRNYIIGPDDEIIIDITGDNEKDYKLKVSPDGTIRLQYVGLISVAGLSVEQAASKIKRAMAPTYPALASGRTNVAVNIGNIRSIKVVITGAITKPGTYTLPSLATVFNALYASGGPSENGSFRNIQVIRNNKVVSTIDVYDFIRNGIQKGNVRLQDQDVINVPVYSARVEMVGEVKIPALFETVKGETLQQVLDFAGGFTNMAYTGKIKVFQNTLKERRITDVELDAFDTYVPKNGDKFIVEPILDRFENRVEIQGAVFRPGAFELEKGLTLKALIQKAEGLKEDAFMYRGYISRLNADNTPSLISFDVAKIMNGSIADVLLQREDKVMISSIFDLRDEYKVSIQGEVRVAGAFSYANKMYLEDLIQMAGGFKEGATPNKIEISRRVKTNVADSASSRTAEIFLVDVDKDLQLSDKQFLLEPFDIVTVRSAEGYEIQRQVKLEGEIARPGFYTINHKNETISDVIKRAGGLTTSAYADGASLKRPGAEKVNPNAKNAINNADEEEKRLLNLKRVREAGVKDTTSIEMTEKLIQSDLVGIDLVAILKKPHATADLILEEGDVIRVPKILQTVNVTGEVLNPNRIIFRPGKSLRQYINGAGGFTTNALKKNLYIKYANGSAEAAKKFLFFNNYPKVRPGAEIFVPERAQREKMTAQAWIGIGTAIATLGAVIISLIR
jgi:protein involved in polysaccharide export with SLBB domain